MPERMVVRGCPRWLARRALAALLPLLAAAPLLANQNDEEVTTDQDLPHREVGYIPTTDASVRGMLATQLSSASRFGTAQIDNVGARIRMLHLGQLGTGCDGRRRARGRTFLGVARAALERKGARALRQSARVLDRGQRRTRLLASQLGR